MISQAKPFSVLQLPYIYFRYGTSRHLDVDANKQGILENIDSIVGISPQLVPQHEIQIQIQIHPSQRLHLGDQRQATSLLYSVQRYFRFRIAIFELP